MLERLFGALGRFGSWVGNSLRTVFRAQAFRGASHGRLFHDWGATVAHPDQESRYALRDLRARARDLVRNNPYAEGVVSAFVDNIVGWEGIRLHPEVVGRDGKQDRPVNLALETGWREWGDEFASVDGVDTWLDLQRLIVRTWVVDGEVFIRERRGWHNPHAYAIQLLDADLLDEGFNVPPDADGVEVRMGIEMDALGRRLGYWFWERHPYDVAAHQRRRIFVPADEVIHFFDRRRVGQNRGYTLFAPVLSTLKMIDGYSEAELVAARLAAAKMGFITNEGAEAVEAYVARLKALNDQGDDAEDRALDIAPGLLEELLPGQKFVAFDPSHPSDAFEVFLKVMLRGVAKGFGLSYLSLTGDLEGANYSSMRAGLLPERDHWRSLQVGLAARVHRRLYRAWRATALLAGALRLPSAIAADFGAHSWRPRGWKWVDPLKDLQAAELAIGLGVTSRTRIASEQGTDFQVVVDEIRDELEYAEAEGVSVSGTGGAAPAVEEEDSGRNTGSSNNGNGNGGASARSRITEVIRNGKGE